MLANMKQLSNKQEGLCSFRFNHHGDDDIATRPHHRNRGTHSRPGNETDGDSKGHTLKR